MAEREFRVFVHEEDDAYWAEVENLPGCFASGRNLDELRDAVIEAITLYVADDDPAPLNRPHAPSGRVDEMRVLVSS
jgi:predicted RNase H-like HicB family nuclease